MKVEESRFRFLLFALVVSSNFLGLFYGPQVWVDAVSYIDWSEQFISIEHFIEMWKNGDWVYTVSYSGFGVPLIWKLLSNLPENWIFPALAVLFHCFAAVSVYYAFSACYRVYPSLKILIFAFVLTFYPFYQTFHNSLMTESMTGSAIMLVGGALIRVYLGINTKSEMFVITLALVIIGLMRPYYLLFITCCYLLAVSKYGIIKNIKKISFITFTAMVVYLVPLGLKSMAFGQMITPGAGIYGILTAHWANPNPQNEACLKTMKYDLPMGYTFDKMCGDSFSYEQLDEILVNWKNIGLSYNQIIYNSNELSGLMKEGSVVNRFRLALVSSGFLSIWKIMPDDRVVFRHAGRRWSAKDYSDHNINHYLFLSGSDYDQQILLLNTHFKGSEDKSRFKKEWMEWQWIIIPEFQDIFHLKLLRPDVLTSLGWLATISLFLFSFRLGLMASIIPVGHLLVVFSIPYGDIRYSYVSLCWYVLIQALALSIYLRFRLDSKKTFL